MALRRGTPSPNLVRAAVAALLVAAACGPRPETDDSPRTAERKRTGVRLVEMPANALARCRATKFVADACPRLVPVMQDPFFVDSSGPNASTFGTFSLEAGVPATERIHEDNRPPQYMRVTIQGGDLEGALDFEYPTGGTVKSLARVDVRRAQRDRPIFLGEEAWSGHAGSLVLAPSYPLGGFHGNHIAFRWTSGQSDYVVSLHAWKPLGEARNALRSIVESIPD